MRNKNATREGETEMPNENQTTISVLNDLIEICRDGQNGFQTAASDTKDVDLKVLFSRFSAQRGEFMEQLKTLVTELGGKVPKKGSVAGAAHRGWINLKSVVTGRDVGAIIAEAERGEDAARAAFQHAMRQPLPPEAMALIKKQYSSVQTAHDTVRQLEIQTRS
jgi:uncharacterized protein (TIGR02284 family)